MDIEVTSSLNITVMLDAGAYVIACNKTVDSLIKISERASRLAQWQRISQTTGVSVLVPLVLTFLFPTFQPGEFRNSSQNAVLCFEINISIY
jgi:hypothetical protein